MRALPLITLLVTLTLAGCAGGPGFSRIDYSVRDAQGQQGAFRSISADGQVEGSHMSLSRAGPMFARSSEPARPEDLREIAVLVRQLPAGDGQAATGAGGQDVLSVEFADGRRQSFTTPAEQPFPDPALARLQAILRSYRAGYW